MVCGLYHNKDVYLKEAAFVIVSEIQSEMKLTKVSEIVTKKIRKLH